MIIRQIDSNGAPTGSDLIEEPLASELTKGEEIYNWELGRFGTTIRAINSGNPKEPQIFEVLSEDCDSLEEYDADSGRIWYWLNATYDDEANSWSITVSDQSGIVETIVDPAQLEKYQAIDSPFESGGLLPEGVVKPTGFEWQAHYSSDQEVELIY